MTKGHNLAEMFCKFSSQASDHLSLLGTFCNCQDGWHRATCAQLASGLLLACLTISTTEQPWQHPGSQSVIHFPPALAASGFRFQGSSAAQVGAVTHCHEGHALLIVLYAYKQTHIAKQLHGCR